MTNPLYEELFEKHRFSEKNFLFLKNKETISYKDYITSVERISFFFKKVLIVIFLFYLQFCQNLRSLKAFQFFLTILNLFY